MLRSLSDCGLEWEELLAYPIMHIYTAGQICKSHMKTIHRDSKYIISNPSSATEPVSDLSNFLLKEGTFSYITKVQQTKTIILSHIIYI